MLRVFKWLRNTGRNVCLAKKFYKALDEAHLTNLIDWEVYNE